MNKKIFTIVCALLCGVHFSYAQNAENRWGFNVLGNLNQYDGTLGNEILSLGTFGLAVGPEYYLSKSFNGHWTIGVDGVSYQGFETGFIDTQIGLSYKFDNGYIIQENARVKPYLTVGLGTVFAEGSSFTNIPMGGGLRINVKEGLDLRVAAIYNKVQDNSFNYFQNTIGLVIYKGGKPKAKDTDGDGIADTEDDCPSIPGVASRRGCPEPVDQDGDGIPDDEDNCPSVAGTVSLNGCPDSDGDGITDAKDECPQARGPKATGGCPDGDGDGIRDSMDECPTVLGKEATAGCPDSDNDGIADKDDKCPNQPGIEANKGCPEIDDETKRVLAAALEGVQFESGRDIIKRSSYRQLDEVVDLMNAHTEFKLKISGYTDNTGNADNNLALSDRRAKAAKQYIVDKGIDASRIEAHGYGIANPVADNSTASGRAKNRRVEFEIVF